MGNRRTWVLSEEFPEFNHDNRARTISELGTAAENSARYSGAFRWWTEVLGRPADSFGGLTVASAVMNHACWIGHGGGFAPGVLCTSRNNLVGLPGGYFSVNVGITTPAGQVLGEGTGIGTGGQPLMNPNASTEFVYDHARWMDPRPVRAVLLTGNYGSSSYYESFFYTGFRVSGNAPLSYDPSYTQHGIVLAGMGEGSVLGTVEVNTCNGHGVWVTGAGPGQVRYLSSFDNQLAGLCLGEMLPGTRKDLGTLDVGFLSCDNNVWALLNNGGGSVTVGFIKNEDGLSASRGRPKKGQVVYEAHGWSDTLIRKVHDVVTGSSPAAFVVNTLANTSRIRVDSYVQVANNTDQNSGRSALLMLPRGRKVWRTADPNGMKLEPVTFEWRGSGNSPGTLTSSTPLVEGPCPAQTRLGLAATYAGYDYAAGTPALDLTFGSAPPPPPPPPPPAGCTWTLGTPGAWGACVNGQETRTTPYVSSVAGCTPSGARPADLVETRACTAPPPPPPPPPPPSGSVIDPADVTVLANSSDPRSAGWAAAYAQAWGIPASNVVSVAAGTSHDATSASANALRSAAQAAGRQFTALAFEYPSRVGGQSITSYVTFGARSVAALTVSPLYGYAGLKPFADKGVRPSWLLVSDKYIRRSAHRTRPAGQAILHLAKDSPSGGNPRGSARAGQATAGVTVWDMRATNIGGGVNACNYINQSCFLSAYRPGTTPIFAGYQSTYALGTDGGAVWAPGFYGDHVTSWGGYLPNGNDGQTPLTYHLNKGAALSVGSVTEPWQDKSGNSPGSLVEQFVDVTRFHPRFVGGSPVGVAAWGAVRCPDRSLFAGDGMCAPFA